MLSPTPPQAGSQPAITFREFVSGHAEADGLSVDSLRTIPYRLAFTIGRAMEPARRSAPTTVIRR